MLKKPVAAQSSAKREERRSINESCVWCRSGVRLINRGTILNESGTGLLLRTPNLPAINEEVCVVPLLEGESSKQFKSTQQLKRHPLMRVGKVVRRESVDSVGIQFIHDDKPRPEFRRWYRGKATLITFFMDRKGAIRASGQLDITSGALIQSMLKARIGELDELIVSLQETTSIATTVLTIMRSSFQELEKAGADVICITGDETFSSQSSVAPLLLHFESQFNISDTLTARPVIDDDAPEQEGNEDIEIAGEDSFSAPDEPKPIEEPEPGGPVLVAARSFAVMHRLTKPFASSGREIETLTNIADGVVYLPQKPWSLFVIDFELDHCEDVARLNEADPSQWLSQPWLVVSGPAKVEPLVRAVVPWPIHLYLSKPFDDREYEKLMERLLTSLNRLEQD